MKKINLSREKIVMSITIGIACLALMLVMFMQFKVVKQTDNINRKYEGRRIKNRTC